MNDLVLRAIQVVISAFGDKIDRSGNLMVLHSLRVGLEGKTSDEQIVGFLHDVIEDTALILEGLREFGFSEGQVEAIDALTRREGETYGDFILRVSKNPLAVLVKLSDLKDNLSRLDQLPEDEAFRLRRRYRAAAVMLNDYL
jgi:(p)ppGpp synthase/HD superfamily hydrolase